MPTFLTKPVAADCVKNTLGPAVANLQLLYMMQEGSGTTVDNLGLLGVSHDGAFVDTPAWVSLSGEGNAIHIDSASDRVQIAGAAADVNFTNGGTILVRFVPLATTGGGTHSHSVLHTGDITSQNGTVRITYNGANISSSGELIVAARVRTGGVATDHVTLIVPYTTAQQTAQVPVTVVFTWDGSDSDIYADTPSQTTDGAALTSRILFGAGTAQMGGGTSPNVKLLTAAIWDVALSSSEVEQLLADPYWPGRRKAPLDTEAPITGRMTTSGVTLAITTETGDTTSRGFRVWYGPTLADVQSKSGTATATSRSSSDTSADPERITFSIPCTTTAYCLVQYELASGSGDWIDLAASAATVAGASATAAAVDGSTAGGQLIVTTRPAKAAGQTVKFCMLGDPHMTAKNTNGYTRLQNAVAVAVAQGCEFCVCIGDLAGVGAHPASQAASDADYASARNLMRPFTDVMPFYSVGGNWESWGGYVADPTLGPTSHKRYFLNPSNLTSRETYWSMSSGDLTYVALDCYSDTTSDTVAGWELDATQRSAIYNALIAGGVWRFVGGHQCLGGSEDYGRAGPTSMLVDGTYQKNHLHPILESTDAEFEFTGHDHIAAASRVDEVTYCTVGTATHKIATNPATIPGYTGCNLLNGQKPYCLVIVTVTPNNYTVAFWRTTEGTGISDAADGDPTTAASSIIYSFTAETLRAENGGGKLRGSETRIDAIRATLLRGAEI